MRVVVMLAGAVLIGSMVWASVGSDLVALWQAAWWAVLVALAFPALIGVLAWRER